MSEIQKGPILAWWFAPEDERLDHGDGREIVIGETHEVEGDLEFCGNGLHASVKAFDAMGYRRGHIVYRVEVSEALIGNDKICGRRRNYLARIDAEQILRQFARECAKEVLHLWDAPEVVKQYLETGDEDLRAAARDAARAAARAAARDAASAAASAAARDAAWAAAWAAAWDAARAAAWAAAWDAARAAAWDAARAAAWDAARAAAWDAAWAAARAAAWAAAWAAASAAAWDDMIAKFSARLDELLLAELEKEQAA